MPRHRHFEGYTALVLSGGYVEAGDCGRVHARPGDVILHQAFEGHHDRFSPTGAEVLNLHLPAAWPSFLCHCSDPDLVARLAERDLRAAAQALIESSSAADHRLSDWPDLLAADLNAGDVMLTDWAARHGLTPSSVSRGFRLAYGVTPQRFRLELKAAAAARRIVGGSDIVDASFQSGFADQPHLSRTIRALYGLTPRQLHRKGNCVQDRNAARRYL
jgi:AraC-like DNA-binding protein